MGNTESFRVAVAHVLERTSAATSPADENRATTCHLVVSMEGPNDSPWHIGYTSGGFAYHTVCGQYLDPGASLHELPAGDIDETYEAAKAQTYSLMQCGGCFGSLRVAVGESDNVPVSERGYLIRVNHRTHTTHIVDHSGDPRSHRRTLCGGYEEGLMTLDSFHPSGPLDALAVVAETDAKPGLFCKSCESAIRRIASAG